MSEQKYKSTNRNLFSRWAARLRPHLIKSLRLRKGKRNVLMIHRGRSGSRVLGLQLLQNTNICWDHELLNKNRVVSPTREFGENFNPVIYAELSSYKSTKPCYGFEMKPKHFRELGLEPAKFIQSLRQRNFGHLIFLTRKNSFRRMISVSVRAKTLKAHYRLDEKPAITVIELDPDKVLRNLKKMKYEFDAMRNAVQGQKVLNINYEDHIENDPSVAYRMVCEFLEYEAEPTRIQLRKSNPFPMSTVVSNYEAIKSKLKKTEFAWMLED